MARYFGLIPAAGTGSRMSSELPKQYLELGGRPLLYHAVRSLAAHPRIDQVFVVLAQGDKFFARHDWSAFDGRLEPLYCGGETRAASVFNGLLAAHDAFEAADWVLVHDAARPCLAPWHIDRLVRELANDEVGGLLAVPVADTLKRADGHGRVAATVARDGLWQAQTPQMFRFVMLRRALEGASGVTDEAGAIEAAGLRPRLVHGDATNLKVTYPLDLRLAEWILNNREGLPG